jgi:hypothetical protein
MNLNIIQIRLKFEFESNFAAAHYCKPQAHPSAPHASPASALRDRIALPPPTSIGGWPPPRVLHAARARHPLLFLTVWCAHTDPNFLSFSLSASTARPLYASFAFPSTARHQPKRTTSPPAPRRNIAVCPPHRRNPPPGTADLEPPSPPSSSIGERHHRPSSSSFPPGHRSPPPTWNIVVEGCLPPPHQRAIASVRIPPQNIASRLSRSPLVLTLPAPPPRAGHAVGGGRAKVGAPHTVTVPVRSRRARTARPAGLFWPLGHAAAVRTWAG